MEYNFIVEVLNDKTNKQTNRKHTAEFKQEAPALVTEQGCSSPKAESALGITVKILANF